MADVDQARGARVTTLNSAYTRHTLPFRLSSVHPVANNPSACEHAPLCEAPGSPATPRPVVSLFFLHSLHPPWKSSSTEHTSPASQRQKVHSFRTTSAYVRCYAVTESQQFHGGQFFFFLFVRSRHHRGWTFSVTKPIVRRSYRRDVSRSV